ncbi:MAG: hypothetical protein JXL80_02555 [Planctomycetes bacterium]|nr:hypothetical protein [Planctomycetota bacterium]
MTTKRLLTATVSVLVALGALAATARAQGDDLLGGRVGGVRLSDDEATSAIRLVRRTLEMLEADRSLKDLQPRQKQIQALADRVKASWPKDAPLPQVVLQERPMQVFVTLYNPGGGDLTAEGRGNSLLAALIDGAANLPRGARYQSEGFSRLAAVRIHLDVTVYRLPYMQNLAEPFLYSMRPGLDGLVYENGDLRGTVLPWEAVRRAWQMHFVQVGEEERQAEARDARLPEDVKKAVFRSLLDRAGAQPTTWRGPVARVLRFETQSFVERAAGGKTAPGQAAVVALYRTGPLTDAEKLTDADVAEAVRTGTDFLARAITPEGQVNASYDPLRDQWLVGPDASRQALAVRALSSLYRARKEAWVIRAAQSAAGVLLKSVKEGVVTDRAGAQQQCAFVFAGLKSEVAWTSQALVALADLNAVAPDKATETTVRQMAVALLAAQDPDGSFPVYFTTGTTGESAVKNSEDLQGESLAVLALVRAFDVLKDEALLRAAQRSADYLVFERERRIGRRQGTGLPDVPLVEALDRLDELLPNEAYARYARLCSEQILAQQASEPARYLDDEVGGFPSGQLFDSESTAYNLRGLVAARRLAARNRKANAERYAQLKLDLLERESGRAIRLAEAFLANLQYRPESSFYIAQPAVASGGLRYSATDARISTVTMLNFLLAETP